MIFPTFHESPAVDALLAGAEDLDLLDVFCDVGGCDIRQANDWVERTADRAFAVVQGEKLLDGIAAATSATELLAGETDEDGRISSAIHNGIGWPSAVAVLEQKVLSQCGIAAEIIEVIGDVLLRVRTADGSLYHPVGSLSVWVEEAVAAGFLHERYDLSLAEIEQLLGRSQANTPMLRAVAGDYFERLCESEPKSNVDAILKYRRILATMDPLDRNRWLAVAAAELAAGYAAKAFRLSYRLERANLPQASVIRKAAESELARLN